MFNMKRLSALAIMLLAISAANGCNSTKIVEAPAAAQLPVASMPKIDQQKILDRIKVLSSDEYEGRKPGTKGEELSVKYIEDQFKQLNLKPGNPDGTFSQKVPLVGITGAEAKPLAVAKGASKTTFKWSDQVVAWTKHVADGASVENSDVVFAGYGVEAPEFNWNDFKDMAGTYIQKPEPCLKRSFMLRSGDVRL